MNEYVAGSTSIVETIFLQDTASTTGGGKTGLVYNTAGLTCYYKRSNGTASVAVTLADISTLGTFVSGGFKAIDGTNCPGLYEFHPPNAAFASGAKHVTFYFQGASGLAVRPIKFRINGGLDPDDGTRGGLTSLPNTACTTNASLLTSGTGTDQLSVSAGKVLLQATQTGVTIPTVTTVTNQLTAAQIATGVWQDATAGDFTVASSIGKSLYTSGNAPGAASGLALVGSNVGAAASVTAAVTVGTNNDKTGYALSVTPPTAAQIATAIFTDLTAGSDFSTAASFGKLVKDNLDAAVSSRSTYAGADTAGTTTLLSRLTGTRAGYLDNLSGGAVALASGVTVTTNGDKTGYTLTVTPPTAVAVADALLGRNLAGGSDGGRTVAQALAAARNKVAFDVPSAGSFTVYATDDTTPLWTGTYSRGANTLGPLTATDPA